MEQAVKDTLEDIEKIIDIIYENSPDLDAFFQPLGEKDIHILKLQKNKGKPYHFGHPSWIRIYALKLESNVYVITGAAIKLSEKMQEKECTKVELKKIEQCRNFLLSEDVFDKDSFIDIFSEN